VNLEEELEEIAKARDLGIEDDLDPFRMRAMVAVGGALATSPPV
jgi:hypothetical protein